VFGAFAIKSPNEKKMKFYYSLLKNQIQSGAFLFGC